MRALQTEQRSCGRRVAGGGGCCYLQVQFGGLLRRRARARLRVQRRGGQRHDQVRADPAVRRRRAALQRLGPPARRLLAAAARPAHRAARRQRHRRAGRRPLRRLAPLLPRLQAGRQQPVPRIHLVRQHRTRLGRHLPGFCHPAAAEAAVSIGVTGSPSLTLHMLLCWPLNSAAESIYTYWCLSVSLSICLSIYHFGYM